MILFFFSRHYNNSKVDDNTNETIPLIIAGGGGGIGVGPFQKDPSALYSDIDFTINGTNGNRSISGAGMFV